MDTEAYTGLPDNEHIYGQSFICVTQGINSLTATAELLYYNHPYVYNSSLSSAVAKQFPTLQDVVAGKHSTSTECKASTLAGTSGTQFSAFGKSTQFGKDLWGECVAP